MLTIDCGSESSSGLSCPLSTRDQTAGPAEVPDPPSLCGVSATSSSPGDPCSCLCQRPCMQLHHCRTSPPLRPFPSSSSYSACWILNTECRLSVSSPTRLPARPAPRLRAKATTKERKKSGHAQFSSARPSAWTFHVAPAEHTRTPASALQDFPGSPAPVGPTVTTTLIRIADLVVTWPSTQPEAMGPSLVTPAFAQLASFLV